MDARFAEPLTVPELAAVAGCSREHFIRAFAKTYGQTPAAYLTRRRVERAAELLRSANLTVTEISGCVGFGSLGTFSRRFKDFFGVSPSDYRARFAPAAPIPGCFVMMWSGPARDRSLSDKPDAAGLD